MSEQIILHLSMPEDWDNALHSGTYVCPSLEKEGFIHACLQDQLNGVMERHFSSVKKLWLLQINPSGLDVRFEPSSAGIFPHIWQPLPVSSVISCSEFTISN